MRRRIIGFFILAVFGFQVFLVSTLWADDSIQKEPVAKSSDQRFHGFADDIDIRYEQMVEENCVSILLHVQIRVEQPDGSIEIRQLVEPGQSFVDWGDGRKIDLEEYCGESNGYPPDVEIRKVSNRKPVSQSADRRFLDFGDGTILDTRSKLMWMKLDYWQIEKKWVNFYTAREFAQRMNNKNFAGHDDWRLPTPEEALLLYDRRKRNIDKDGDKVFIDRIFPKGCGWGTWTSSEKGAQAIVISYKDEGGQAYQDKINGPDAFLRLVRGPVSSKK